MSSVKGCGTGKRQSGKCPSGSSPVNRTGEARSLTQRGKLADKIVALLYLPSWIFMYKKEHWVGRLTLRECFMVWSAIWWEN